VRKVMQVAGIHNVLTKSIGTSNPAQRRQSHLRGASRIEGYRACGGDAFQRPWKKSAASLPRKKAATSDGRLSAGEKAASTHTAPTKAYNRTEHDGKKSGGKVKIKWVVSFISLHR